MTSALLVDASRRWSTWLVCLLSCLAACSGGGSGSSAGRAGQLVAIEFPDPEDVNPEGLSTPPSAAPLNQQICFEFSEPPQAGQVGNETIQIRDSRGETPSGSFRVEGTRVIFTPNFPIRPVEVQGGLVTDSGGAGLLPGEVYSIRLGPQTWPSFLTGVQSQLQSLYKDPNDSDGVILVVTTTEDEALFFRGIRSERPRLLSSDPSDGALGVTPQLHGDPAGLFPPRRSFRLTFDRPIHPSLANLDRFRLIDLDDRSQAADGLSLGVDVCLIRNEVDHSTVEVMPSGILPFGHLLSLEYPSNLQGLGEEENTDSESRIAATFTIATAPSRTVVDRLRETFDTNERESRDIDELGEEAIPASWDIRDSNVLTANFAFDGRGELGRLVPSPGTERDPRLIVLDTSSQTLPLLDGSTPDALPGTIVGGRFSFTDIDIPEYVTVEVRGPNPLILTATGSVRIAGTILMNAGSGPDANTIDSAVFSLPGGKGGPGGGRGGVGHPIVYRGQPFRRNMVTPLRGGQGWGPANQLQIGGRGGVSGSIDNPDEDGFYTTDRESTCTEFSEHNPGFRPGGGGGGSFLETGGKAQKDGIGNVLPDGRGGFILRTPETHGPDYNVLAAGDPGQTVFQDDLSENDFIGLRGEIRDVIGGQGGGGGGSGFDTYYCGNWCKRDDDPTNDRVCKAEFGFGINNPDSAADGRGGGGGGGGGAFSIRALGEILIDGSGQILCNGGLGGGGELAGCGSLAGSGGGGAGGAILLQSGTSILVKDGAVLETKAGRGKAAARNPFGCGLGIEHPSSGGSGSVGLIQLQVPRGMVADVETASSVTPRKSWVDKNNIRNPSEFTPISAALSNWYDMGRAIDRPPRLTNPIYSFQGVDPATGQVLTDEFGNVRNPSKANIRVDFLGVSDPALPGQFLPGQEPRANFIPPNATVTVEFQGAEALTPGSKEIDPESKTEWSPLVSMANGKQFVRYRIRFDLTAREEDELEPEIALPTVQEISIRAEF